MHVKSANDVQPQVIKAGDKTTIQVLISSQEGPNFAMRRFVMQPGGGMPNHTNTVEHEQYVLRGRGNIGIGSQVYAAKAGDVVFIPAGVPHEHIIPKSQGGKTTLENLALACQGCNNHKYNKTEGADPINGQVAPLYHPRKHRWNKHFAWNDDFTLIIGLTPIGRATVESLQLNREGLVNLRKVLYAMGEHPPAEA